MPKVIIMRHGESQYNLLKRYAGWLDCDLTPEGIEQARKAGQVLKDRGHSFDVAYTSMLKRASETLRYTLEEMGQSGVTIHRSWKLNERHFGALDDLTREEAEARFGAETMRQCREDFTFSPPSSTGRKGAYNHMLPPGDEAPDSESMYEATVRCVAYWSGTVIPSIIAGKNVLVVAHGDILRMLTGHLLGMSEADIVRFPVLANATPTVLDLDDDLRVRSRHSLMDTELNEPV